MSVALIATAMLAGSDPASLQSSVCSKIPPEIRWMDRPYDIEGTESFTYRVIGENTPLRIHLFMPADNEHNHAAIVLFFGGGWAWGTVRELLNHARHLAHLGMVVAVADYRVLCRDGSSPLDSVDDAKRAIAWLRTTAADHRVDPHRIIAGGTSSGGHLAVAAGMEQGTSRPDAIISISGPVDVTEPAQLAYVTSRFGQTVAKEMDEVSPMQHVDHSLPPTLFIVGLSDAVAPYDTDMKYCRLVGPQCSVVGIEGAGHDFISSAAGFPHQDSQPSQWYDRIMSEIERYLREHHYLP